MLTKMEFSRFQRAVEVANGWILDFMCCCLFRYFSEDLEEEFTATRNAMNGFVQWPLTGGSSQIMKVHICQLLSRIVEAKNLDAQEGGKDLCFSYTRCRGPLSTGGLLTGDEKGEKDCMQFVCHVQFDKDERITPLESALSVLVEMEKTQDLKNDHLYQKLKQLLQIQAVAVCLEKGDWRKASEVLERQFDECVLSDSEQSLKRKLSTIITKKDPYHRFLQNFNHQQLIDNAKVFADKFLSDKKSNFLVQAANKVVESKEQSNAFTKSSGDERDPGDQYLQEKQMIDTPSCSSSPSTFNGPPLLPPSSSPTLSERRPKKRLYSLVKPMTSNLVKPENTKDSRVKRSSKRSKRIASLEHKIKIERQNESIISVYPKKKIIRKAWLHKEDMQLKKGVKQFGCGNWSRILQNYEFDNRTNVMLKDRWRTMRKLHIVDSSDES